MTRFHFWESQYPTPRLCLSLQHPPHRLLPSPSWSHHNVASHWATRSYATIAHRATAEPPVYLSTFSLPPSHHYSSMLAALCHCWVSLPVDWVFEATTLFFFFFSFYGLVLSRFLLLGCWRSKFIVHIYSHKRSRCFKNIH